MTTWELQGFIDGYGDGHPAWSVVFTTRDALLSYIAEELDTEHDESVCSALLIRRGPRVDVADVPGPYRLVPATDPCPCREHGDQRQQSYRPGEVRR